MANVSFNKVCKVYPSGIAAVSDFDLDIQDKEFMVLVGPSGSGKSTVLRMIAGLEDATSGEIMIDGQGATGKPARERGVAMVFQNYALFPHMTVYDNIALGLKIAKTDKAAIKQAVHSTAEVLGISDTLRRKPKALSGGQKQRVALARALVMKPQVFLLDEPLSNLDAKLRSGMRAEIIRLHRQMQTTFVYVTHDQVEAMTMGTRIAVMHQGFIRQVDTPQNLYTHPADKFVAGFIGTPQMNFFDAFVGAADGKPCLYFMGQKMSMDFWTGGDGNTGGEGCRGAEVCLSQLGGEFAVSVGIRAEDICLCSTKKAAAGQIVLPAVVTLTEELGNETIVYAALEGRTAADTIALKCASGHGLKAGDNINITLSKNRFKFFDAKTEKCIRFTTQKS